MKIKIQQIITAIYFILIFIFLKEFSIFSIAFFAFALLIDYFTNIKNGTKNLLYFLAALSVYGIIFGIFLIFLPFIFFGSLLKERNFLRDYLIGFGISFIPSTIIYLAATYFSVPLKLPLIIVIFYIMPLIAIIKLRKKPLDFLGISSKGFNFMLIILFFTLIVASNTLDSKSLYMANGAREFYRVQIAVDGLKNEGLVPIYDPAIGMGEATYLWVPPVPVVHFALANLFLGFYNPILFFNAHSLFLLLISAFSLGILYFSINKSDSAIDAFGVASVTLIAGLNFFILQSIESVRAFYGFPLAHLLLSLVLNNPKQFREFVVILYLSALMLLIHSSFGIAVILLAACILLFVKIYYLKEHEEIRHFMKWAMKSKLKLIALFFVVVSMILFYVSTPFIFKEYLVDAPSTKVTFSNVKASMSDFLKSYAGNELRYMSFNYPDVSRIDDHRFGFFVSVIGATSLVLLLLLYKLKSLRNFRAFAFGFVLHIIGLAVLSVIAIRIGGFFRTPAIYLLTLLGASIITLIFLVKNKYAKSICVAIVLIAFLHSLPYAQQNISNIHQEQFMSGEIYKSELEFISKLPVDGRIMDYGLFNNVIDYGIGYITGRYGSRSERTEGQTERSVFEKIHGQNSFGDPNILQPKSGTELYNYLRLGGYKYVFLNAAHPIGAYVASQVYPNFTYPVYQNGPFVFLVTANASYAEKVDLVQNVDDEIYKEKPGYKYTSVSPRYGAKYRDINFKKIPGEPVPLSFERPSPTVIRIFGNFNDNEWVLFKEQYFSRWHAYMDNKEIPVLSNYHELILIRTIKGNSITLEYSVLPFEKVIAAVSLLGFLGMIILIMFLVKQEHEENSVIS